MLQISLFQKYNLFIITQFTSQTFHSKPKKRSNSPNEINK